MMNANAALYSAIIGTPNLDASRLPDMQAQLINLFSRCADEVTIEQCLDAVGRVAPDGVMDASCRAVALRFLSFLQGERSVRDVQHELAQDLDHDALAEWRAVHAPLSEELRRDAAAVRAIPIIALSSTDKEDFACDLDHKSAQAFRLEQRVGALEAQIRHLMRSQQSECVA